MKLSAFKKHLLASPESELRFVLPDGGLIETHAHITEVGRVEKTFIDCGGTVRRALHCSLQAWVADDVDHRLLPGRLASIIDLAAPILGDSDLDVEIEYQDGLISQFPVVEAEHTGGALLFRLTTKQTDCLAKERCLVPSSASEACCSGSGCC
jgi:hypothetical protein